MWTLVGTIGSRGSRVRFAYGGIIAAMSIFSRIFNRGTAMKHAGSIGGEEWIAEHEAEEPTEPVDFRNADDSYVGKLLAMGAYLIPYHDDVIIGINNRNSLVIATKNGGFMLLRAHAQQKHGYMWMQAVSRMRNATGFTVRDDGRFGAEAVYRNVKGDECRIIGHDDDRWYLMAYINVQDDGDNELFDWFFGHIVIDRGEEPMAPGEWLNPELPDKEDLLPAPAIGIMTDDGEPHAAVIGTGTPDASIDGNASTSTGGDGNITVHIDGNGIRDGLGLDDDETQRFQQELERKLTALMR